MSQTYARSIRLGPCDDMETQQLALRLSDQMRLLVNERFGGAEYEVQIEENEPGSMKVEVRRLTFVGRVIAERGTDMDCLGGRTQQTTSLRVMADCESVDVSRVRPGAFRLESLAWALGTLAGGLLSGTVAGIIGFISGGRVFLLPVVLALLLGGTAGSIAGEALARRIARMRWDSLTNDEMLAYVTQEWGSFIDNLGLLLDEVEERPVRATAELPA